MVYDNKLLNVTLETLMSEIEHRQANDMFNNLLNELMRSLRDHIECKLTCQF